MAFNKISRARNLLNEAQLNIACIRLNPTQHADELKILTDVYRLIENVMALLNAKEKTQ
jgi:hypothetical protein